MDASFSNSLTTHWHHVINKDATSLNLVGPQTILTYTINEKKIVVLDIEGLKV